MAADIPEQEIVTVSRTITAGGAEVHSPQNYLGAFFYFLPLFQQGSAFDYNKNP